MGSHPQRRLKHPKQASIYDVLLMNDVERLLVCKMFMAQWEAPYRYE